MVGEIEFSIRHGELNLQIERFGDTRSLEKDLSYIHLTTDNASVFKLGFAVPYYSSADLVDWSYLVSI